MSTRRIQEFLDGSKVSYIKVGHSPEYSAQTTAESLHLSGHELAKTVIVRIDSQLAMAVVPASKNVDLELLRRQIGARQVSLAWESDFVDRFAGCQLGTVPPFGNLFGVATFIDSEMVCKEEIVFPAGTHTDLIIMNVSDYERLARPTLVRIAVDVLRPDFAGLAI